MPPSDATYRHDPHAAAMGGLQLGVPVDRVPPEQYSQCDNVIPVLEGQIITRPGLVELVEVASGQEIHTIFRLTQSVLASLTDRIVGLGTRLFTIATPPGDTKVERTGQTFSGSPLSILSFRFALDQPAWAIIADRFGMRKYRSSSASSGGYYQKLGIAAPTTAATASANGAGNLNSTGGTSFDWRYTYLNRVTGSESNGSPVLYTAGGTETKRPTANTNPDTAFAGSGFTNPANAYDGSASTYASGTASAATENTQSCNWNTFAASGGTVDELNLAIEASTVIAGTTGAVFATIYYSLDAGSTWKTVVSTSTTLTQQTFYNSIPIGTAFANIQVRAVVKAVGITTEFGDAVPNWVLYKDIYKFGGDLDIGDLYTGDPGDMTIELRVYDIRMESVLASATDNLLALVNQQALVCVQAPSDTQVTSIRLYRRGGSFTIYKRVGEFPITELSAGACGAGYYSIADNVADSGLGDELETDNDEPVYSVETKARPIPFIWGPFDERVMGCGDPDRPGSVYWSKRGNADQWPSENYVEVAAPGTPVVNGCVYNTRTFAFSPERLFELVPDIIQGVTFTPYPTPCSRGLVSPYGLVVADAIYFVSKDGVYRTTGGQEEAIDADIKPLFPTREADGQDVGDYEAIDLSLTDYIRLSYNNNEVWFTYKGLTSGTRRTLIFDIVRRRWRSVTYTPEATMFYAEEATQSNLLVGGANGSLYETDSDVVDNGLDIAVSFRTGAFDQGTALVQKQYGNVLMDINPGGATALKPITVTPYYNEDTTIGTPITITGSGRQIVPLDLSDVFSTTVSFNIEWTRTGSINPILYGLDILWRPEQSSVKHWESLPSSLGMVGYFFIRDMYVCIRSNASVTLTINFDGTSQTYTVASTAGEKRKVYVPLASNKGKVYSFALDSTAEFRLYASDIEVRCKPCLGVMGYTLTQPFGAEEGT